MAEWVQLFVTYRVAVVRDEEIVQGLLRPDLDATHPVVRSALDSWEGPHFVQETPLGPEVTLVRRRSPPRRERWWLHGLLFALAGVTTTAAGARLLGHEPFPLGILPLGPLGVPVPFAVLPAELVPGLVFSVPLMMILLGHELGHYLVARRHGMDVSPPFFLPAPRINVIGTFGAFIRLRSPVINRAVLLDVGGAGPIASFVLSLPFVVVGLLASEAASYGGGSPPAPFAVQFGEDAFFLGGSLLFHGFAALLVEPAEVLVLHPLAFAGWLGLFVTALNLFPLSQLDGGHILYALVRDWQPRIGVLFLAALLGLGSVWWGWWFWALLILLIGRGSIRHPAVFDPRAPVTGWRRRAGWACVVIFVVTFVPVPFRI